MMRNTFIDTLRMTLMRLAVKIERPAQNKTFTEFQRK